MLVYMMMKYRFWLLLNDYTVFSLVELFVLIFKIKEQLYAY